MYPAARNVFVALATVVMFAALADAATPDKALGTFPGCEWRYRPQNPDSKLWLYCPDKAGKWKRAYFGDDFDPHTVEQARAGDAKAIGILGNVYMNTSPVQDTSRGLALLRQASDMGDNVATRSLALNFLWSALNKPENKTEEVRLLRIAAERGDAESMRILGYNYGAGWGVDADNVEAARWYRKAAEKGNALAMLELGKRCFAEGCPAVDVAEGLLWLRAAADAGNAEAMYRLAEIYESGKGTTKDPAQSTNWQTRGDAAYVANLIAQANKFDTDENYGDLYEKELAEIYLRGERGVTKDVAEAIRWYTRAANHGNADATFALETLYEDGKDVPANKAEAEKWSAHWWEIERERIIAAANGGDTGSMIRLAVLNLTGKDSDPSGQLTAPIDYAEAVRWLRKAAGANDPQAMMLLSQLYAQGKGVEKSADESKRWSDKAAATDPAHYASIDSVIAKIDQQEPFAMIDLALRLWREGRQDDAVFWYYLGELRIPPYAPEHSGASLAMGAIQHTEGPIINGYAFGDIPKLLATIDRVLAWDESHPDVKVDAATREKLREGFKKFRADIVAKQDEIRAKRTKAGLPNVAQ